MSEEMLSIRKNAMEKRSDWGFRGLNPQPIDRAGEVVSVAWSRVVDATDEGPERVEAAISEAEAAEEKFRQEWN